MALNRKIPIVLIENGKAVKSIQYDRKIYLGDPINICKIFSDLGADEIIYLDISASSSHREPDYNLLRRIARQCSMPMTYGGGIKTVDQAKKVLSLGIEKVAVQTQAFKKDDFLAELSGEIGVQSTLLSIDVKFSKTNMCYEVFNRNESKCILLEEYLHNCILKNVGEIILANMDFDGMKLGPDLALIKKIRGTVKQPLIYSGGVYSDKCFENAFAMGADAVAASSYFVLKGSEEAILINYPKPSWKQ